jgi:hypothetical protein
LQRKNRARSVKSGWIRDSFSAERLHGDMAMDEVQRPARATAHGPVDRTVGMQIVHALQLRDVSMMQLAEQANIEIDLLSECCAGQKRLPASALCDIARILRLPVSYFFTPLMRTEH